MFTTPLPSKSVGQFAGGWALAPGVDDCKQVIHINQAIAVGVAGLGLDVGIGDVQAAAPFDLIVIGRGQAHGIQCRLVG